MPKIVYPTLTGWVGVPPYPRFLNATEPWAADDPFVKENPQFFGDAPLVEPRRSVPVVEQATAAPGETRDVTKADAAFDEAAALRVELADVGVKVDKRWSLDTLREKKAELDKVE
jgi:hypothetical protein